MEEFWKAIAATLLAVILSLAIGKTEKDLSLLLTMAVCTMVAVIAVTYLEPVLDLLWELHSMGQLQDDALTLLLKAVGIAMVSELASMICSDAGNSSMAKTLQLLASTAIAYLSIPIFQSVLILIRDILFKV